MHRAPVQPNGCMWNAFGAFGGPECGVKTSSKAPKTVAFRETFEEASAARAKLSISDEAQKVIRDQLAVDKRPRGPSEVIGIHALD